MDPETFWSLTPREMQARLDGAAKRIRREHDLAGWLAWHIGALSRVKKMPRLKDMMSTDNPEKIAPQTPEQIESILRGWMAARKH